MTALTRALPLLLLAGAARRALGACTQGVPSSCTFPPGQSETAVSRAGVRINPCVEYATLVGLDTGYQAAMADPRVNNFSDPSVSVFCYPAYGGPNAGTNAGGVTTQTFSGTCGAGYYGSVSAMCSFSANTWNNYNYGTIRGILTYNLGRGAGSNLAWIYPGSCNVVASGNDYPTFTVYAGFDKSSGNSIDPTFVYNADACFPCAPGVFCPAGTAGTPTSPPTQPCPAGWACPGGGAAPCPPKLADSCAFGAPPTRTARPRRSRARPQTSRPPRPPRLPRPRPTARWCRRLARRARP